VLDSSSVLASFVIGAVLLAAFIRWELRATAPMLSLRNVQESRFRRDQCDGALVRFGMFGTVFFLSQFLQTVQGTRPRRGTSSFAVDRHAHAARTRRSDYSPSASAVSPGRHRPHPSGRQPDVAGVAVDADDAVLGHGSAFIVAGVGMTLFFVPVASLVLGSVPKIMKDSASGTNAAFRELGGVFGSRCCGAVFSSSGGYLSRRIT